MKKIFAIKSVKSKTGKPFVLVTTTDGSDLWIPYGQWTASCSANLQSYVGGFISALFYQVGEMMLSGVECTSANTIIESFSATQNPSVVALVEANFVQAQAEEMNTLALIARKKRLASAPKAPTASPEVQKTEQPAEVLKSTEEKEVVTTDPANTDGNATEQPQPVIEQVETHTEA